MELKPGLQLASAVCGARVVVVKAPPGPVVVACGGTPMVPAGQDAPAGAVIDPALRAGAVLGKRYEGEGVELLCTAAGEGTLTIDGHPLSLKTAKPLPASD
jgi:hypothetical protein